MAKLRIADGEAIVQLLMELDKAHGEVVLFGIISHFWED